MKVYHLPPRQGKTSLLAQWVKDGVETDSYPGWSRVLLVHSEPEASYVRKHQNLHYHQVFTVEEWQRVYLPAMKEAVEVAIDNAQWLLQSIAGGNNIVGAISIGDDE